MNLNDLGWNPHFASCFDRLDAAGCQPARIVRQDRSSYRLVTAEGAYPAHLSGRLHRRIEAGAERPVVGDWVAAAVQDGEGPAVVHDVLPRRSAFSRKEAGEETREQVVAANIDAVLVVCGLDADFNLRRIERYVAQAWNSGATPVLVLNKADACPDVPSRVFAAEAVAPGVAVHAVSAEAGAGLDALEPYLRRGCTAALVGSSGVGKSTLVNHWLGPGRMRTGAVRAHDGRGRHTTTHRELLFLPSGGMLIDTPGMRELQVWGDDEGLQEAFPDVEILARSCRFRDCTHERELGCAVREAVREGRLDAVRLRSYQKLRRELDYLALRQHESATYREHQRGRGMGKMMKQMKRHDPKRRNG